MNAYSFASVFTLMLALVKIRISFKNHVLGHRMIFKVGNTDADGYINRFVPDQQRVIFYNDTQTLGQFQSALIIGIRKNNGILITPLPE